MQNQHRDAGSAVAALQVRQARCVVRVGLNSNSAHITSVAPKDIIEDAERWCSWILLWLVQLANLHADIGTHVQVHGAASVGAEELVNTCVEVHREASQCER
jgi:hypothetical protein